MLLQLQYTMFALLQFLAASTAQLVKIDCQPETYRLNPKDFQSACTRKGCVWDDSGTGGEPYCYLDPNGAFGYKLVDQHKSGNVIQGSLLKRGAGSIFGNDYAMVNLTVQFLTDNNVRILITDKAGMLPPVPHDHYTSYINENLQIPTSNPSYDVEIDNDPFAIRIVRKSTGTTVFDTTGLHGPILSKRFIQMSTRVPSGNLYGIGEHAHNSFRRFFNWEYWPLFSRDFPPIGAGQEHWNLYGVHPFYMCVENDGNAHAVLLMNAHAQSMQLQPNPNAVTYRTVGGRLDFSIYLGPEPAAVISQYTRSVGLPYLPPYWSLGYQLSRWGYGNTATINKVNDRNVAAGIPFDVHYMDIDYMAQYWDFTYDGWKGFAGLPEFVQKVHDQGGKVVPILDPGIPAKVDQDYYPPLKDGLAANIFVKSNASGKMESLLGSCWPGETYWPDFTDPKTFQYWLDQHRNFFRALPVDGVWYDMNEPSNFKTESSTQDCQSNDLNFPPYAPNMDRNLNLKTICMDAIQYAGRHFDVHSLYGFYEAKVSHDVLANLATGKRPFLIGRSTFPGSGKFGAHWTGDVYSQWYQLKLSVISIQDVSLFGIPQVGADICGFNGETNEQLCIRWHQLGVFYPFSRNHNTHSVRDQDPASWSKPTIKIMKSAIEERYKLLPYYYTLFHRAHSSGRTVARPLFFEFPGDPMTRTDGLATDTQFMVGPALMVTPVLWVDTYDRSAYFPASRWFRLTTGNEVQGVPGHVQIATPIDDVSAFVRGGYVIPRQAVGANTNRSRGLPMDLLVALDNQGEASGELIWDDGETLYANENNEYYEFSFVVNTRGEAPQFTQSITITRSLDASMPLAPLKLDKITIYGVSTGYKVISVSVNGDPLMSFDLEGTTLVISNVGINLMGQDVQDVSVYYRQ